MVAYWNSPEPFTGTLPGICTTSSAGKTEVAGDLGAITGVPGEPGSGASAGDDPGDGTEPDGPAAAPECSALDAGEPAGDAAAAAG
ncbi:hypothetical protein GCM10025331_00480 [Actinoplanes utahensis]|nr:hypothetical protein Aut01nite_07760 [Actinoplanes utahensis]